MVIKSPYNFVPLSETVVFPDWADKVSHDVPFSDGKSGVLSVEITAESSIYIRNGGTWEDNDRKDPNSLMQEFFTAKINGTEKYIIPGTSLKGVFRNVLEIVSFGKMGRVADHRYSIRDLYYGKYTSKMTEKDRRTNIIRSKVKTGWLTKDWEIIPCDHARVEANDLIEYHGENPNITSKQSSKDKYNNWGAVLEEVTFNIENGPYNHSCGRMEYKKVTNLGNGENTGYIVFTGQASIRKRNERTGQMVGKHMEFIFFNEKRNNPINVSALKKEFIFIHSNERGEENEEWSFWHKKMKAGEEVPIFYLENNGHIESFGLAMMYRLPYTNTIYDAIKHTSNDHFDKKPDFAELIFGFIREGENKNDLIELKGRVQVSHFKETEESAKKNKNIQLKKTVMGSPRPTFYPNYVVQPARFDIYKTFMDSDVKIRGWKRYPAENREPVYSPLPRDRNGRENTDVATMLKPLPKDVVFEGKVRFHNLKPIELGALLWSLKFGDNENCQHQIGMGKALGLGRISIKINGIENGEKYIQEFEEYMNSKVNDWKNSEQLKELLTMADITKKSSVPLEYPILQTNPNINEFAEYKDRHNPQTLQKYSDKLE